MAFGSLTSRFSVERDFRNESTKHLPYCEVKATFGAGSTTLSFYVTIWRETWYVVPRLFKITVNNNEWLFQYVSFGLFKGHCKYYEFRHFEFHFFQQIPNWGMFTIYVDQNLPLFYPLPPSS